MEANGDNNNQGHLPDRLQPFPASEDGFTYEEFLVLRDLWNELSMEDDEFHVEQPRQPVRQGMNESEEEQVARAKAYFRSCPPGYRFLPTDEELIKYYLLRRVNNEPLPINRIRTVALYDYRPDVLVGMYYNDDVQREQQWYFFTLRDRKYPKGTRPSRSAAHGYWKASGVDKAITSEGQVIGFRKALDFYDGKQPSGRKTEWKMNEYRLDQKSSPPNNSNGANSTKGGIKKNGGYQEATPDQNGVQVTGAAATNKEAGDAYLLNEPSPQIGSWEMGTTSNSTQAAEY